ncbi:MAG: SRPBCC domain-containing protein [Pseudodonghicola sp.]|nr:SRPBCC domain-containing protein [Pseudodonghicola sp.]
MHISGEHVFTAPRETVWARLSDTEVLQACIPGCEDVVRLSETEFFAMVLVDMGPEKIRFSGDFVLSEITPLIYCAISGKGNGGAAGFAKGAIQIRLHDLGVAGTRLSYQVQAKVGGKLEQLGQSLIESASEAFAAAFLKTFTTHFSDVT